MSFLSAFTTAVLPVLAISAVGFLLGRVRDVDTGALSTVTVYVLAPALVFHTLATTSLGGDALVRIAAAVVAFVVGMSALAEAIGRALGMSTSFRSALVLTATYPNSGNLGIPLSDFAFGEVGRATAVVFLAVQSVLIYTHGVFLASRGSGLPLRGAVEQVFRVPLVYAVVAAGAARVAGVVPPAGSAAMRTVELVGEASIPVMLLLLGIQLADTGRATTTARTALPASLKLLAAPAVGVGVVLLLGFEDPVVARTVVLECATPAAITPLMLAVEFEARDAVRDYVSAVVLVTTVFSAVTLSALVVALRTGVLGI